MCSISDGQCTRQQRRRLRWGNAVDQAPTTSKSSNCKFRCHLRMYFIMARPVHTSNSRGGFGICFSFDDLLDAKASAPRVRELAHGVLEKRPRVQSPDRQHQSPRETRRRKAICRNADHPDNHSEIDIQEVHHTEIYAAPKAHKSSRALSDRPGLTG